MAGSQYRCNLGNYLPARGDVIDTVGHAGRTALPLHIKPLTPAAFQHRFHPISTSRGDRRFWRPAHQHHVAEWG